MRNAIQDIIFNEFSRLIENIEGDFVKNYIKKTNNFLLNQLDDSMTANMVFVSSFESKSGFTIESCAKQIARLKYGDKNVPAILNPHNLHNDLKPDMTNGQVLVTNVNIESGKLRGEIARFRATNMADGKGKKRVESGITQQSIKELLKLSRKYYDTKIYTKPVNLGFFDGTNWIIMGIKAGGELDSSNAPSNVEKLLTVYTGLNISNCKIYFATLYNKNGEGNTWTSVVKKHLCYPEMFLIGKEFWEMILPDKITYNEFTEIYKKALTEIDLNRRINHMIGKCIRKL